MSYTIMADMLDIDFGHDGVNRLAGMMAVYASNDGAGVWASVKTFAKRMGRDERTVQRHIKKLRDAGVILEVSSPYKSTEYRINLTMVRLLVNGVVRFAELLAGKVTVKEQVEEPQLVLPGLEGAAPACEHLATELSASGDRDVTQIGNNKTIPRARGDDDDLKKKMIKASDTAVDPEQAQGLRDLSEVRGWLSNGADLDMDVLPVVAARSAGKEVGSVYSWAYYRRAVMAAFIRRTAVIDLDEYRAKRARGFGPNKPAASGGQASPAPAGDVRQRNLATAIKLFEQTGYWDDQFGQKPDINQHNRRVAS